MSRPWVADVAANFSHRIGRDLTESYCGWLPTEVTIGSDERLVVIPRSMLVAAKPDIPDA